MKLEHRFLINEGLLVFGLAAAMYGHETMTYIIAILSVLLNVRTFGKKRIEEEQFNIACVCLIDIVFMAMIGFQPQIQALIPLTYASAMSAYVYNHKKYRCLHGVKQIHLLLQNVLIICGFMIPTELSMKLIAFIAVMVVFAPMSILIMKKNVSHHTRSISHTEKVISVVE